MEDNETIHQALERELQEELPGIRDIQIKHLIDGYKLPKVLLDGNGLMLMIYKVEADLKAFALSSEHIDYAWIEKTRLDELCDQGAINEKYLNILNDVLR